MSQRLQDPAEIALLKKMRDAAPKEFEAWRGVDKVVGREDGAIPRKYRELIALAVAAITQCPFGLDAHTRGAQQAGATDAEIAETILIASAMRAGGGAAHGTGPLKVYPGDPT